MASLSERLEQARNEGAASYQAQTDVEYTDEYPAGIQDAEVVDDVADFTAQPDDEVAMLEEMYEGGEAIEPDTAENSERIREVPLTATSRVGRILQRIADRLENGADRADSLSDKTEQAKKTVGAFGRAALTRLKTAGAVTVKGVNTFSEKVGDGMLAAGNKLDQGMDVVGNAIDAKVSSVKETVSDYRAVREQAAERKAETAATAEYTRHAERMQRKNAALARKQARHAKWASRREGLKQYGRDVKEGFVETKEAGKKLTAAQKRKLGAFAARAQATGEAAIDTWKSYPDR